MLVQCYGYPARCHSHCTPFVVHCTPRDFQQRRGSSVHAPVGSVNLFEGQGRGLSQHRLLIYLFIFYYFTATVIFIFLSTFIKFFFLYRYFFSFGGMQRVFNFEIKKKKKRMGPITSKTSKNWGLFFEKKIKEYVPF